MTHTATKTAAHVVGVLTTWIFAIAATAADFSGKYVIDAEGQYTGTAWIVPVGDCYKMIWNIDGAEPYEGIAIGEGDVLSVAFTGNAMSGVVAYRLAEPGKLVGRWTTFGTTGKLAHETLHKQQ